MDQQQVQSRQHKINELVENIEKVIRGKHKEITFVVTALIGLLVTVLALLRRPYRRLSTAYRTSATSAVVEPCPADEPAVACAPA